MYSSPRRSPNIPSAHPPSPDAPGHWPTFGILLAPILASKVICIGKNYAAHAAEMGGEAPADPVIFIKPNTSIIGPEVSIVRPPSSQRVDYEGELAVVIGKPCKDVPAAKAASVILGYTIANDVTARDHQQADGQWTRGKGYDTFCPLGPWIDTEFGSRRRRTHDPTRRRDQTTLANLTDDPRHRQDHRVDLPVMTLLPGDVLTGTPEGVGPMTAGQRVSVTISGLGTLSNPRMDKA